MAFIVKDRVRDTTTTTGTGAITLSGTAPLRYRNFASVLATSDTFPYAIVHQSVGVDEWEVGIGTLSTSTTFARTTVIAGTNSTSAVVFSAGTKDVMLVDAAKTLPFRTITGTASQIVVTNGDGVAGDPTISLDQTILGSITPTGRLTVTSGTPVPSSNTTAQSTVYYTPAGGLSLTANATHGPYLPSFNGTSTVIADCGGEPSFILDATNHTSGNLYDFFWDDAGARLVTGPAWTSATARNAALGWKNGWLTNSASMTGRISNNGGTTTIATSRGLYLGTIRTTANAQTGVSFNAIAAGGTALTVGLFNAYNRVHISCMNQDNTATWAYTVATWRRANNSAAMVINYVDGLQVIPVDAEYAIVGNQPGDSGVNCGIMVDWVSGAPTVQASQGIGTNSSGLTIIAQINAAPLLGYHTVSALEIGATGVSFEGSGSGQAAGLQALLEY